MSPTASHIRHETIDDLLCLEIGSKVTLAEYQSLFLPAVESIVAQHNHIRVVLVYGDSFEGWDADAAAADLEQMNRLARFIKKIALVNPPELVKNRWQTFKPLIGGELHIFNKDKLSEALEWAKEPLAKNENIIMPESKGNVLCIEVRGLVTYDYYIGMYLKNLRKILQDFGKARLLFYYPDPDHFLGWETKAADVDFSTFNDYAKDIEKIAIVNTPAIVSQRWDFRLPLLGGEFREFEKKEDLSEALAWIKNDK